MKLTVKLFVVFFAMLLIFTSCSSSVKYSDVSVSYSANLNTIIKGKAEIKPLQELEGQTLVAQKGYLAMYADIVTGYFTIQDLRNGELWKSIPENTDNDEIAQGIQRTVIKSQIVVDTVDLNTSTISKSTSYATCEMYDGISVSEASGGINVVYDFKSLGVIIPVAIRLMEDGFRIQIDSEKIVEGDSIKLLNVSVFPMMGAQEQSSSGYMLLANGSGSILNFNNYKTKNSIFFKKVYGDDQVYQPDKVTYLQENYSFPVYGIQAGNHGLFAVADMGAANANVYAASAGQVSSYNCANFSFDIRGYQTVSIGDKSTWNYKDVVTFEDGGIKTGKIGVRYFILGNDEQGVPAMASVLREYIKADGGFTNTDIPDTTPLYLTALGAFKRTASFCGVQYSKTESVTTLKQATEMVETLEKNGVSGIRLLLENWSSSLLENKITTGFDVECSLGNKTDIDALCQMLTSSDGNLGVYGEFVYFKNSGNGAVKNTNCIKNINSELVTVSAYKRSTQFPDPDIRTGQIVNVVDAINSLSNFSKAIKKQTASPSLVLGTMGNTLYSDFANNGLKRQAAEELIRRAAESIGKDTTMIGDNPCYYVMPSLSSVINIPSYDTSYDCLDGSVPFYQMVLHGSMLYGSRALNVYGDQENEFLKCIETGAIPHYELVYNSSEYLSMAEGENFYGANFNNIKDSIAEQYRKYDSLYQKTAESDIVFYKQLAEGIVKTGYANGIYTLVNYNENEVDVGGKTVAAKDFVIGRDGE